MHYSEITLTHEFDLKLPSQEMAGVLQNPLGLGPPPEQVLIVPPLRPNPEMQLNVATTPYLYGGSLE